MGTSTRNLGFELIAAAFLHVLVLVQKMDWGEPLSKDAKTLTVELLPEPKDTNELSDSPEFEPVDVPVEAPLPKSSEKIVPAVEIITATKPEVTSIAKIKIETSTTSNSFTRFLNNETNDYRSTNPKTPEKFGETFTEALAEESPPELSPFYKTTATRGSTTFSQEYKGKRTCVAKIVNLLDIASGPSYTTANCTPQKKFDLKLNAPNSGWTKR